MPRKYIKKNKPKKYCDNDLKLAIEAVSIGSSIRAASNKYNIPYTTLNSHINGIVLSTTLGRPTKFTNIEEDYLTQAALALQVKIFFLQYPFFLSCRY